MKLSRRSLTRLIVGAPVAAAAAAIVPAGALFGARAAVAAEPEPQPQATPEAPEETPLGRFLARQEGDLSSEEKRRIRKQVATLEQSLKEVRAYVLGNDVPPAGTFRALKATRAGRGR